MDIPNANKTMIRYGIDIKTILANKTSEVVNYPLWYNRFCFNLINASRVFTTRMLRSNFHRTLSMLKY